jgi:hypothetical protein
MIDNIESSTTLYLNQSIGSENEEENKEDFFEDDDSDINSLDLLMKDKTQSSFKNNYSKILILKYKLFPSKRQLRLFLFYSI